MAHRDVDNGLLYNVTTQRKSSFMTFVKELFYINKINPFSILPLQYDETVPQYAFLNPYAYYLLYEWQQESHHLYIWLLPTHIFHLIQITGNIHSSLKRQRRFQNGYMIFKIHIQSLLSPYSSFITIYRHLKWINKNTTVINNYINRNTIKYNSSFYFLNINIFEISAKVSPSINTKLSPFIYMAERKVGIRIFIFESRRASAATSN